VDLRKRIKIGAKSAEEKRMTPGALRHEAFVFLVKTQNVGPWDVPSWMDDLLNHLEDRFTAIRPSVSDRAGLMAAIAGLIADTPPAGAPETIDAAAVYLAESLGLDVTGDPELRWFEGSPDAGDPLCICSYCECLIDEGTVPIRFFDEKKEQRLHPACLETCIEYGLVDPATF